MASDPTKADIQKFWKALFNSLYDDVEIKLDPEYLVTAIKDLEDMFRYRNHGAVVEMPLDQLAGKRVLEIGSGAGGHSVLFAHHGANVTSVDITAERARSTDRKFRFLGNIAIHCRAVQGDAENLAFPDGTFDIVYSNGVLHHTLDTGRAVDEVSRVLKPGGQAILMLYCKSSWHYWINMFVCVGLLQGKAFRRNWLGRATEWGGADVQAVENPITRCYTRGELTKMFSAFQNLKLRKTDFYFYLIPKIGRLYRRYQIRKYGTHPGGYLVYGEPWPIQSPLELKLGRLMGFSWWISARKPD